MKAKYLDLTALRSYLVQTHVRAHTGTCVQRCTNTLVLTYIRTYLQYMYTSVDKRTHIYAHTHYVDMHVYTDTRSHAYTQAQRHVHTCAHTNAHTRTHMQAHTRTFMLTCTYTCIHGHTYTHIPAHAYIHLRRDEHPRTQIPTHTDAARNTYISASLSFPCLSVYTSTTCKDQ